MVTPCPPSTIASMVVDEPSAAKRAIFLNASFPSASVWTSNFSGAMPRFSSERCISSPLRAVSSSTAARIETPRRFTRSLSALGSAEYLCHICVSTFCCFGVSVLIVFSEMSERFSAIFTSRRASAVEI